MNFRDESEYNKAKIALNYNNQSGLQSGLNFNLSKGPVSISGFTGKGYKNIGGSVDLYKTDTDSITLSGSRDNFGGKSLDIKGEHKF